MVQLRTERLRKGRAALRARWQSADLLVECGDLRRAGAAMGDAGAGEQGSRRRGEKEAAPATASPRNPRTTGRNLHFGLPDHRICQFKFQVPERFRGPCRAAPAVGHTSGDLPLVYFAGPD